ncbi:MAG TPA: MarC family protein [Microvirga sp.]|nr:MarC family protein [Microvirga sp.]
MDWSSVFQEFVKIWVVVDPIGTVPVFLAVTVGMTAAARRRVAVKASLTAAGILMFFLVLGQFLLDALEIRLDSFQIAGGIVLFLFALTMIFGPSKPEAEASLEPEGGDRGVAVFPLAVPSIASPGAMLAVVVLTDNNRFSFPEQAVTATVMLFCVGVTCALMLLAGPINRVIGSGGASIISRVMGIILAAVAVDGVLGAISDYFRLS